MLQFKEIKDKSPPASRSLSEEYNRTGNPKYGTMEFVGFIFKKANGYFELAHKIKYYEFIFTKPSSPICQRDSPDNYTFPNRAILRQNRMNKDLITA